MQGPAANEGWAAVANLDVFFTNMYSFYHHRGFPTVLVSGIANMITLGFTVVFSTFLFSWLDWGESKIIDEPTAQSDQSTKNAF